MSTNESRTIKVVVADDHLMIREGVKHILSKMPGFAVVAEAESGVTAFESVLNNDCDLLVIDINLPDMNGIEVLKKIKSAKVSIKVVILSVLCDRASLQRAIDAGADGYILKDDDEHTFCAIISNVMRGFRNISPRLQSLIVRSSFEIEKSPDEILTGKEMLIFKLVVRGLSNREIAEQEGIALRTVDFHKRNIKDKLHISTIIDFVRLAEKYDIK